MAMTVRDYLKDLIDRVVEMTEEDGISEVEKEELLDEYTGIIKERIVG
jgi:hypothetical protein